MIFSEPRFLLFFLGVLSVHWLLSSPGLRKSWLLVCSYAFYAGWDARFLALIAFSTLVDYGIGPRLAAAVGRTRRRLLLLSLVMNLGVLGVFKYCNFFIESAVELTAFLGLPLSAPTLNILLPVGISFYTFQSLSYTIDVYRGDLPPCRSLRDFALFIAFFPQLVAGPIVRASAFLPQLETPRRWDTVAVRRCLVLFLIGFFKKACIADSIARAADPFFASPELYTSASAWVCLLLYAIQMYADFSGYSDMAIATAGLLGYDLGKNFNFPLFARNVGDYWRRWHMSLSSWLRDYLFFPLGGSRGSPLMTYRNILITMILTGLWHGAGWGFVIWGILHGGALVVFRECRRREWRLWLVGLPGVGMAMTLTFFALTRVFFRAPDLETAGVILKASLLFQSGGTEVISARYLLLAAVFFTGHLAAYRQVFAGMPARLSRWSFAAAYGVAVAVSFTCAPLFAEPFIYFQF